MGGGVQEGAQELGDNVNIVLLCKHYLLCVQVLAQELGDNVNIQSLLNNASNFRGRAQQIIALQNKVGQGFCFSIFTDLCDPC